MNNRLINVKEIMQNVRDNVKSEVETLPEQPHLVVVQVGENPASATYIRNKQRMCEEVGIKSTHHKLGDKTTQEELRKLIEMLNQDESVHGILVQLPLPNHISEQAIAELIDWKKDVDGFHPILQGKLMRNEDLDIIPIPCTPAGIMEILKAENVDLNGKRAIVVGRSNIVGKPVSMLLQHANATVTMCHSRTLRLSTETKRGDIVIAAIGQPKMFNSVYFTGGQYVIDVGINRDENNKLCGDVNVDSVFEYREDMKITPVPSGVGIATVSMLLVNTLKCYRLQKGVC